MDQQQKLPDIVLVRSSSPTYDPRVTKIIKCLSKRYSLVVAAWNRGGPQYEKLKNPNVKVKILNLGAPVGKPSLVKYFPIFWTWVLIQLFIHNPKVVHACDLDTVLPCYIYKLILRRKLIFEVFDRYAMVNIPVKHRKLYSLVNSLEEQFSKRSDILVTVSDILFKTFHHIPSKHAIVMNCPEDYTIKSSKSKVFTLVYTGPIVKTRGLQIITSAIKELDGVELLIAGRVHDKELLDEILQLPNVRYEGVLLPSDALALEARSDVMVVLYDLKVPINNYAMPNKLFEAMMLGIPLITNLAQEVIEEFQCGILVEYGNVNRVREAIIRLRDDIQYRNNLGQNSRKAFLHKYNWSVMEKEYYKVYDNLLSLSGVQP